MEDFPNPGGLLGHYANSLDIGHNSVEFVLDFGQRYPGEGAAHLAARIITSPLYAKRFLEALEQSVRDYEHKHGPISEK